MVKLNLLIAKFDFYIVPNAGKELFSCQVSTEGMFLFLNPVQFALLWPWVKV